MATAKVYPAKVHIVIDLETLSLDRHGAVIDIAAVMAMGSFETQTFRRAIIPSSYEGTQFEVDPETAAWHETNNPGYLAELSSEGVDFQCAAQEFNEWLGAYAANAELHVWSQGKDFDFPVLDYLFKQCGIKAAYKYRNVHCIRDLLFINPRSRIQPSKEGTPGKHTAMQDAMFATAQFRRIVADSSWLQKLFD